MVFVNMIKQSLWFVTLLTGFLFSLTISWWYHYSLDFFYGFWYDLLDINKFINKYAPLNRYSPGFERLEEKDYFLLFQKISESVHSSGEGLEDITYSSFNGKRPLLRTSEVVHLRAVAELIDNLKILSLILGLITFGIPLILLRMKIFPNWKHQLSWLFILSGLTVSTVLLIGSKKVFYKLHVLVFPSGHKWHFYYEESLMAVLLKAPDIFGGIAVSLLIHGFLGFSLYLVVFLFLQRKIRVP